MTKEQLRQYQSLRREIAHLQGRVEDMARLAQACADEDGLTAQRYSRCRARLQTAVESAIEQYDAIEDAIAKLPSDERMVMRYRYIEGYEWDRIAERINYTERNVHYIHSNALIRLKDK